MHPVPYQITESVIIKLKSEGIRTDKIEDLISNRFLNKKEFRNQILERHSYSSEQIYSIFNYSLIDSFVVDSNKVNRSLPGLGFTKDEKDFLKSLHSKSYSHKIDFEKDLFLSTEIWKSNGNKLREKEIEQKRLIIEQLFRIKKSNKTFNQN